MFCSRKLNAKINNLHHRALRIVYRDYVSSFEELLKVDSSCSIHHRNIKFLAIELYKVRNNLSPEFMSDIFLTSNNNIDNVSCNTRNHSEFYYETKIVPVDYARNILRISVLYDPSNCLFCLPLLIFNEFVEICF